nr:MAG: hypothetical protein [Bacteriophage sp.]
MAVVDELVTVLSTVLGDGSEKAVDTYKKGLDGVVATVKEATKRFAMAATGLTAFVAGAVNSAASIQKVSETTGVSTDALQEWAYAAKSVGVSASAVESDLAKMQKQAMWTGRSLESWADTFKGMSVPQANMWGDAIGISPDTVRLLREGREGIAALRKEAHSVGAVISPEDLKRAAQLKTSVMSLTTQLRAFGTTIAIGTLPMIDKLVTSFKEWLNVNKEWVASNITKFLENLGRVFNELWEDGKKLVDWFKETLGPIGDFGKKLWEATDWAKLLKGALVLLVAYFAPAIAAFGLAVGAVIALSAAFEDFIAFLEGKDSIIGRLVDGFQEKFPNLANLLKNVVVVAFELVTKTAGVMWELLQKIASGIGGVVETIVTKVDQAIGAARRLFGLEDLNEGKDQGPPPTRQYNWDGQQRNYNPYAKSVPESEDDVPSIIPPTEEKKEKPAWWDTPQRNYNPYKQTEPTKRNYNSYGEVKRPVERKPESPQKEEKPAWWDTPQRNYNPYAKSASSSAPKNVSARVQLEEAGKELARNSTAMQQSSPSDKGPVIVPKTETRPSVTNRNQTNQSNLNANVKIEVRDPSEIGPALKSLETAYPDAQINTPGTYGPSVG